MSRGDNQPVELTLPDGRKIKIRLQVLSFNLGINTGAVRVPEILNFLPKNKALRIILYFCLIGIALKGLALLRDALLGWTKSDNQPGIDSLRKAAHDYQGPNKAKVNALMSQINEIWESESYKRAGTDPAKLPARILALSYLLGFKTAFNCKSGKDRTGVLDIEAKFLLTELELTGTLPTPDQQLTPDQQSRYAELVRHSGNYEVQACNTGGAPGYKIDRVMRSIYAKRVGEENIDDLIGLSGEVSD